MTGHTKFSALRAAMSPERQAGDPISKYGADTAAYLAYKAAVLSVGVRPLLLAEFAVPAEVMRHIVLVVDAAKAVHATLAEPEHRSWFAWPWR